MRNYVIGWSDQDGETVYHADGTSNGGKNKKYASKFHKLEEARKFADSEGFGNHAWITTVTGQKEYIIYQ